MPVIAKVQIPADGHLVLPEETREALGIRPGALVFVRTIGAGKAEIEVIPDGDTLPTMTLDEMIERFRAIAPTEPYDDAAVREAWQAEAADELIDRIRRGIE